MHVIFSEFHNFSNIVKHLEKLMDKLYINKLLLLLFSHKLPLGRTLTCLGVICTIINCLINLKFKIT